MSTIKDVEKIDLITYDEHKKQIILVMVEPRKWCSDDKMYEELNEKFNNYLSFVEDGQMNKSYQDVEIDSVKFELLYSYELSEHANIIVGNLKEYLLNNDYCFEQRLQQS